jgi:hypothetical protein
MHRHRLASLIRRWALVTGLALGCVGTGCGGGGQTGGESPLPANGGCQATHEELALDVLTPLGATAASVLEPVLGTHTAPLLWNADTGTLTVGPEQGLSEVEVTASYAGGTIRWARFGQESDESAQAASTPALSCAVDRLEIELDVRLRTGGGALDERFEAWLGATAVDNAQLATNLPFHELQGSLFAMTPQGVSVNFVQVSAVWDVMGFRGTLMGGVEMIYSGPNASSRPKSTVGFGLVPLAQWPPPPGNGGP